MAVTFKKPVDDEVPWDQRLVNYAANKDAGKSEYQRALEVYRGKSALGDTEGANQAKKWSDQVNTAIGGIGDNIVSNRADQINKTTDTIGQKVNADPFQFKQTAAPFQYNADSDQSYQAALRQAQRGAQTAQNNAMVGLGSRGIGNSSVAVDRANQIQQSAIGNVNDTILPQLMQQAYGRYQDQNNNDYRTQLANYQAGQDQVKNLTGYAGTLSGLNQQQTDNTYRDNALAEQVKGNNYDAYLKSVGITGNLGTGPKSDYSLLGGTDGPMSYPAQQQDIQNTAQYTGFYNGMPTMQKIMNDNTIRNMTADNARAAASEARAAGNQSLATKFDVWDRTGQAPDGIPGVTPGTGLVAKPSSSSGIVSASKEVSNKSYSEFLADIPRLSNRDEGLSLIEAYRQDGVDEATLQKMLKEINSKFKN